MNVRGKAPRNKRSGLAPAGSSLPRLRTLIRLCRLGETSWQASSHAGVCLNFAREAKLISWGSPGLVEVVRVGLHVRVHNLGRHLAKGGGPCTGDHYDFILNLLEVDAVRSLSRSMCSLCPNRLWIVPLFRSIAMSNGSLRCSDRCARYVLICLMNRPVVRIDRYVY